MTADVLSRIQDLIARIAKIPPPLPDADIYVAGIASVDALELLVELEDAFGVTIPDDSFVEARTATALATLIGELTPGNAT